MLPSRADSLSPGTSAHKFVAASPGGLGYNAYPKTTSTKQIIKTQELIMRKLTSCLAAVLMAVALPLTTVSAQNQPGFRTEKVVEGIDVPWGMTWPLAPMMRTGL